MQPQRSRSSSLSASTPSRPVASLARPGGNLTGLSVLFTELAAKRLALLSELVSQTKVFALLVNPNSLEAVSTIREIEEVARGNRAQLHVLKDDTGYAIDTSFHTRVQREAGELVVTDA